MNALDNDELKHVLMTDEANFNFLWQCQFSKLSLLGNQEPSRYSPLYSEKVIVWCGVASFGVIGPSFFEDEAGRQGSNSKFSPLH